MHANMIELLNADSSHTGSYPDSHSGSDRETQGLQQALIWPVWERHTELGIAD